MNAYNQSVTAKLSSRLDEFKKQYCSNGIRGLLLTTLDAPALPQGFPVPWLVKVEGTTDKAVNSTAERPTRLRQRQVICPPDPFARHQSILHDVLFRRRHRRIAGGSKATFGIDDVAEAGESRPSMDQGNPTVPRPPADQSTAIRRHKQ